MRNKYTYSIIALIIVVGACLLFIWRHQRVENNLKGICASEGRVLSREELYQRAMLSYFKREIDASNKYEMHIEKTYMPFSLITRNQFIQTIRDRNKKGEFGYDSFIAMEPLVRVEQLSERLRKEPKNKFVLTASRYRSYYSDFDVLYDSCCNVLSEEEAMKEGVKIGRKANPATIQFDPELAKRDGYGLYYLKMTVHKIISQKEVFLEKEGEATYQPISNCGDVYEYKFNNVGGNFEVYDVFFTNKEVFGTTKSSQ